MITLAIRAVIVAAFIYAVIEGVKVTYQFGHSIFYASSVEEAPGTDVSVTVRESAGISDTASMLYDRGLIENKLSVMIQSKFFELDPKPGVYTLNTSMTSRQILEILDDGPEDAEEKE